MCSQRRKNHGRGRKNPNSTRSAISGVEIAAKSCELKRCADRVRNRTDEANLNFSPNFFHLKWTFRPPPKRQLSILLNCLFPLTNLFLTLVVFACFATTQENMRFRAKHTGFSTGLYPVYEVYWWPCGTDGRTYGRTVTWLLRHY